MDTLCTCVCVVLIWKSLFYNSGESYTQEVGTIQCTCKKGAGMHHLYTFDHTTVAKSSVIEQSVLTPAYQLILSLLTLFKATQR